MDPRKTLDAISGRSREAFHAEQTIRSYSQYLRDLTADPYLYCRSAPQYLADMFDYYGSCEVETSEGTRRRWKLFDAPWEDSDRTPLVGQEYLQTRLYQAIRSFAREGRADKILLIHGPNGSGKTTVTDLVFDALERYSREQEGMLYRYSWVFPSKQATGGQLGFRGTESKTGFAPSDLENDEASFAHLDEGQVDLRMACELRDHPLLLIPRKDRRGFIEEIWAADGLEGSEERAPSPWLLEGEPCHKCRQIYDALLTEYRGDLRMVLRHVRVERWYVSRRYRRGAVSIHPQLHVDAKEAQISSDRSLAALPASLQTLTMFTPMGDLIDANAGLLEFSDLLKRPLDLNHYLLNTVEKSQVALSHSTVHLNLLMMATSNETHLEAFKKMALWPSFKARLELISAPYLLEYRREAKIYADTRELMSQRKHVAPHTVELASLWAVLTRLQRPDPEQYPAELRTVVRELSPLDKALLYDSGSTGSSLSSQERIQMKAALDYMKRESYRSGDYEGLRGASPREMRQVLLYSLYDGRRKCVTPMDLLDRLEHLCRQKGVYEFLDAEPDGAYRNPTGFIDDVRDRYLHLLSEEVRDSMELVAPDQYRDLFARYLLHVKAQFSGETIRNRQTGQEEQPDEELMREIEGLIAEGEDAQEFRRGIISRIGAWRVDNPEDAMDYLELFPELIGRLREDVYGKHHETIEKVQESLLRYGTEEFDNLDADLRRRVEDTIHKMESSYGYCEHCAKDAISFLLRNLPETSGD